MLLLYLLTCNALFDSKQGYKIVNIFHIDDLVFLQRKPLDIKSVSC